MEYPFVLGTGGHIDHGKTTLVKALTGVDCDRLLEEKRRGITIELGFAPLRLGDRVVSIVDVPGHERFIRQMVAGAAGVDAVMMVVAADEGVMPQTREHLEIMELLGVRRGIVVITKCDAVEPDLVVLAQEDVREAFRGTFLQDAPVIPVSAVTGQGLEELKGAIGDLIDRLSPRDREGDLFLPIDRAFSISGFGTVVTGTVYQGSVTEGQELEVLPSGLRSKVRSLQVHGERVHRAVAGQRVAVNVPSVDLDSIRRGDVLVAQGACRPTDRLDVWLYLLPSSADPLKHWQRVRLLMGTSEVMARIMLLDRPRLDPGLEAPAQLMLEEPVAAVASQRFIIRFYSPLRTIGGGQVLLPYPDRVRGRADRLLRAKGLEAMRGASSREERVKAYLQLVPMAPLDRVKMDLGLGDVCALLDRQGPHWVIIQSKPNPWIFGAGHHGHMIETASRLVGDFHRRNPSERGMPLEELARACGMEQGLLRSWLGHESLAGLLELDEGRVKDPSFARDLEGLDRLLQRLEAHLDERGFLLPELWEMRAHLGVDDETFKRVVALAKERGLGVILPGDLFLSSKLRDALWRTLAEMGEITVATVRDRLGLSRKYVMPMLEHLDSLGITRRVQDKRVLLKKPG